MGDERLIAAKYTGTCTECGYKINVNDSIMYNTYRKTARHFKCPEPDYSGTEQKNMFDAWIEAFQKGEGKK